MNELLKFCEKVADTKLTMNGSKISQRERNNLKREFIQAFKSTLESVLNSELITVVETQKGIGIAIDNEHVGFIPIEIVPTFKDTDCDIIDLASEYETHAKEMQEKAEKKAKAKAEKIAKDKAERERKARAKELAQSESVGAPTQPQEIEDEDGLEELE